MRLLDSAALALTPRPGPSLSAWTFQVLRLVSDAMHRTSLVQATCEASLFCPGDVSPTTGFVGETREQLCAARPHLACWVGVCRSGPVPLSRVRLCVLLAGGGLGGWRAEQLGDGSLLFAGFPFDVLA